MSAHPWVPRPRAGDIVQCRFPESKVGTPGPKDRPALVIEVEEDPEDEAASIVRVAYGTSQDVEQRYPGELTVRATDPNAVTTMSAPSMYFVSTRVSFSATLR